MAVLNRKFFLGIFVMPESEEMAGCLLTRGKSKDFFL